MRHPRLSLPSLSRAAATLAVAALATAPAALRAQQSYSRVGGKLQIVGNAQPCVYQQLDAGTALSASCGAVPEEPTWCPFMRRNDPTIECKLWDGNVWKDLGLDQVSGAVSARTDNGRLRVDAALHVETRERARTTPGYAGGYQASAQAEWRDNLDLGPVPVGGRPYDMFVRFTAWLHGDMRIAAGTIRTPGIVDYDTRAVTRFSFDHTPDDAWDGPSWTEVASLTSDGNAYADRHKQYAIGERHTFTTFVGKHQRYVPFALGLSTEVWVPGGYGYDAREQIISSHAVSNFGNTAGLAGVDFLALDGTTPLNVGYTFLNGTQLVTTTPEPATAALTAGGLLALAAAARRRRRGA